MTQDYTVEYFIAKFEAIPEHLWTVGTQGWLNGPRCALGHCISDERLGCWNATNKGLELEADALYALTEERVAFINNGHDAEYAQPTPKARILAALRDIKAKQDQAGEQWELRPLTLSPQPTRKELCQPDTQQN